MILGRIREEEKFSFKNGEGKNTILNITQKNCTTFIKVIDYSYFNKKCTKLKSRKNRFSVFPFKNCTNVQIYKRKVPKAMIEFNKELKYKELCKMLNEEEVVGGANRERQLSRMNKRYEVEKIGRGKYMVKREKSEEEIKLNSDKQNYSRYLQTVLLNMIANNPDIEMIFTYRQIRENLMMVNSKYFPVKYHKYKIEYDVPSSYGKDDMDKPIPLLENDWIRISDQHDKAAIKYALKCLKEKNLITNLTETYLFYKFEEDKNGNTIFNDPVEATSEQLSEIHQLQLNYIKDNIPEHETESIKQRIAEKEDEMNKTDSSYYGQLVRAMYTHNTDIVEGYYSVVENYVKKAGYDRYARAFKILRPKQLKAVAGYFAPVFNEKQVDRYLSNKRFNTMPIFFHNQIVEKLIKEG